MIKNYKTTEFPTSTKNKLITVALLLISILSPVFLSSQTTYTFTNANATGQNGPSQTQVNSAYALTNLNGAVVVSTLGIQQWTVPLSGVYRIEANGAQGGASWGLGARMIGDFTLTAGTVLKIVVGQQGGSANASHGSGGGGSFVLTNANSPLIVAGGGGGRGASSTGVQTTSHGSTVTAGQSPPGGGPGGTGGGGGAAASSLVGGTATTPGGGTSSTVWCSGGGGFFTDGGQYNGLALNGGRSFFNNALGGDASGGSGNAQGGFGGGGGCGDRGAGGGGYSGGGGGTNNADGGGGGGSINNGSNQNNTSGINTGNGRVIITALCNITVNNFGSNPICIGNSATLTTNAVSNYAWSNGGTGASLVVSPTVNTTYTLTATSPSNCTASAVITVSVDVVTPTVTAVISSNTVCAGKTVVLTASGANTYTWTGGAINGQPYSPPSTSGFTVVGGNGCGTASAAVAVTVEPLPNVTASVVNPTVCNGGTVTLIGGGSVSGYTWTNGAINNTPFAPQATNVFTVTGIAANGCTASAVASVTVLITPNIPPVATPTSACLGTNATLTAIGATGYTWTPGLGLNSFSAAVSPPGSTTYTLFRSNGACTSTTTVNLVINPLPFANATASPSLICAGDPVALNVIGGITYTWLPGGFTSANFTFFPNSSGSYTATSSNGSCTATGVVQVSVNTSPVVGINSSTTTVCAGGNVTLTATGNAATYTWLPGNSNGNSVVVTPTAVSQYTLIGNNAANCANRQTQLILVNAVPPLVLNSSVPFVCTGTTAILSIANATLPGVTYSWSSNSGSGSTTNVSPTVTTTYFASAVTNSTGCSSSGSLPLTVNISTFVVASPSAICRGNSATIVASGAANSYNWSVNGVGVGNTASITVSPTLTTNYVVLGTTGGCSSSFTVPLIVNLLPNVVATAVKPQICRLENGTLTATGANSYTWNTNANTQSIIINSLTVTSSFTVTGTDLNNCVKSSTVTQFVATCLGIEFNGEKQDLGLSIYPNPNQGNFTISSEVDMNVSIVNELGQLVYNTQVSKDQQKDLRLGDLPNGIYLIVAENKGVKVSKKIVIEK